MEKFVHMITALLLFLVAVELCFVGSRKICDAVIKKQMQYDDEVLYEKMISDNELILDGYVVTSKLYSPAQTDILICCLDGNVIRIEAGLTGITVLKNVGRLSGSIYKMNYIYGDDGRKVIMKLSEIEAGDG